MISGEIKELQDDLRAAKDAVLATLEGVSEAEAHDTPAPNEWTVCQLLAHIAELQVFWIDRAVLITQEDDPQIARNAVESDLRVAAVTQHAADNMADLVQEMVAANNRVVRLVGGIDPSTLDRPGHREENPITAGGVIRYVAGHVRTHAEQITESLRLIRQRA